MRHVDADRAAATLGIARGVHAPAACVRERDQPRGLALRLLANLADAYIADDPQPRLRRVQRRHVRRAVHEAIRRVRVPCRPDLERKRIFVHSPPGERRHERAAEIGPHVEIRGSRSAAEPFQHAAAGEIDLEIVDGNRHAAQRLKGVQDHVSSDLVSAIDDRLRVLHEGAAKDDVRDRHQQCLLVCRRKQPLGIDVHGIVVADHVHARATRALRLPEIHDRRKIQVRVDDFVSPPAEVEARCDHGLTLRDVLVDRDGSRRGAHQRRDLIAHLAREHPPALRPGAHAACRPHVGVLAHRIGCRSWHRAEGIGDQVRRRLEDRKFIAVSNERIGHRFELYPDRATFDVRRSTFDVRVRRSACDVQRSSFVVRRSSCSVLRTPTSNARPANDEPQTMHDEPRTTNLERCTTNDERRT